MDQTNTVRVLLLGPTLVLINWNVWVNCTAWAQLLPLPLSARFHITAAMDPRHGVALYSALQIRLTFLAWAWLLR